MPVDRNHESTEQGSQTEDNNQEEQNNEDRSNLHIVNPLSMSLEQSRQLNHNTLEAIGGPSLLANITAIARARSAVPLPLINLNHHNNEHSYSRYANPPTSTNRYNGVSEDATRASTSAHNNRYQRRAQYTPTRNSRMTSLHLNEHPMEVEVLVRRLPGTNRVNQGQFRERGGVNRARVESSLTMYSWPVLRRSNRIREMNRRRDSRVVSVPRIVVPIPSMPMQIRPRLHVPYLNPSRLINQDPLRQAITNYHQRNRESLGITPNAGTSDLSSQLPPSANRSTSDVDPEYWALAPHSNDQDSNSSTPPRPSNPAPTDSAHLGEPISMQQFLSGEEVDRDGLQSSSFSSSTMSDLFDGNVILNDDLDFSDINETFFENIFALVDDPPIDSIYSEIVSGKAVISEEGIQKLKETTYTEEQGDSTCSICIGKFEKSQKCLHLTCKHMFHKECICRWLRENSLNCPLCRQNQVLGIEKEQRDVPVTDNN